METMNQADHAPGKRSEEVRTYIDTGDRYYATTRQLTGTPYIYHAYVYDRASGRPVMSCSHHHRTSGHSNKPGQRLAQECAERMLARQLRKRE